MYNEVENLPLLHERLTALDLCKNNFYVFVDDCSSDESVDLIHALFKNQDYFVIEKKQNAGPGDSFNLGFNYLLEKYEDQSEIRVITMEADNTSDVSILYDMLTISDLGYDLVLASIYAQGGGFSQTSFFRKLLSFGANMVFRAVFNVKILTLSSFYRIYHLELLAKIKSQNDIIMAETGFICMLEILLKAIDQKAKIIEIPMVLKSDIRKGKSKMNVWSNSILYLSFLLKHLRRPMKKN